ncbi:hypothetical protein L6452_06805 [Arctium lappa]|uniref:Uncharacterized protein n=1 Tax=Arctium lappa TaxID=4217 RepID=A0ACB9EJL3_ARCLA|nr:hypothetical protein L6452_06805 [Arctium lappa]
MIDGDWSGWRLVDWSTTGGSLDRMRQRHFTEGNKCYLRVRGLNAILKAPVNRIETRSDQFDMYMLLDVNTEVYPMHVGEKFMMVLASTLNLDGTPDSGFFTPAYIADQKD